MVLDSSFSFRTGDMDYSTNRNCFCVSLSIITDVLGSNAVYGLEILLPKIETLIVFFSGKLAETSC